MVASIDVHAAFARVQQLLPMQWHHVLDFDSFRNMQSMHYTNADILCK